MNDLQEKFNQKVRPALMKEFGYRNIMECPDIEKVSINVGLSQAKDDKEFIQGIKEDLTLIAGQVPVITKARKSIAGFKTRQGQPIGMKITLRGGKMWDFIYRLIGAALPRIKDFRGLSTKAYEEKGNFSIGIKEHLIFPEISTDNIRNIFSFQVNVTTKANDRREGIALLRALGFPLKKDK